MENTLLSLKNKYFNNENKFQIFQTYIKFDLPFENSVIEDINKNGYLIVSKILDLYSNKYPDNVEITIENHEGSFKTKIIIWGLIINIITGISNYGSFRSGLETLIKDGRHFSELVINSFSKNKNPIIRYEKRGGLPGRLLSIYKNIEKTEKNLRNLSQTELEKELNLIKQDISNIIILLDHQTKNKFLDEIPQQYKTNLPPPDKKKAEFYYDRYALTPKNKYNNDME